MGIIHWAYAFKSEGLRSVLNRAVDPAGELRLELLRIQAKRTWDEFMPLGRDLLESLCIDMAEEGFFEGEPGVKRLVTICAAGSVSDIHRLSQSSFAVLELLLPALGWPEEKVRLLLLGRQFHGLVEALGVVAVAAHIDGLIGNPSWFSPSDAAGLAVELGALQHEFIRPSVRTVKLVEEGCGDWFSKQKTVQDLLSVAFNEMEERLSLVIKNDFDLLLVNDYKSYFGKSLEPV